MTCVLSDRNFEGFNLNFLKMSPLFDILTLRAFRKCKFHKKIFIFGGEKNRLNFDFFHFSEG